MPISSKMRPTIVMVLGKRPERREGTSEKLLVSKMSHASVRTVSRGTEGRALLPTANSSIIDSLVERIA